MRVLIGRIELKDHPHQASLQVGVINGHQVVVGKHYDEGTLGFFIPAGAIIPDKLADEMWVKGRLAGAKRNRVKARKMEGIDSEGLFYASRWFDENKVYNDSASWNSSWVEGQDVTEEVGIIFDESN